MPDPAGAAGGTSPVHGHPRMRWCSTMEFVVVFGLLALFSIIAIAASAEDPRAMPTDPRDNPQFWAVFGRR